MISSSPPPSSSSSPSSSWIFVLQTAECRVFLVPVAFYALDCLSDKASWYLQIPLFEQAIFPSGRSPCWNDRWVEEVARAAWLADPFLYMDNLLYQDAALEETLKWALTIQPIVFHNQNHDICVFMKWTWNIKDIRSNSTFDRYFAGLPSPPWVKPRRFCQFANFLVESSQDFKFWIWNYLSCPKRLLVSAFLGEIVRCHLPEIHLCLSADTPTNTRQVNWSDKYKRQLSTNPRVTGQMDFRGRGFEEGGSHKEKDGQIAFCLTLDLVTDNKACCYTFIQLYT